MKAAEEKLVMLTNDQLKERIIEPARYQSWYNGLCGFNDSYRQEPELDCTGLNDHEKMVLYIYSCNKSYLLASKKSIIRVFGWTNYKVQKMFRELKPYGLECLPAVCEETGLLAGRGYYWDDAE